MEFGKTRKDCFLNNSFKKKFKLKKDHAEKFSEAIGIEIQSQHWGGNKQLLMEDIAVEYFQTSVDNGKNEEKY